MPHPAVNPHLMAKKPCVTKPLRSDSRRAPMDGRWPATGPPRTASRAAASLVEHADSLGTTASMAIICRVLSAPALNDSDRRDAISRAIPITSATNATRGVGLHLRDVGDGQSLSGSG